ncbi:MAG: Na(+)-translocating NADH-quinone reductase subunit C [Lentisphaerae bacterium ADurb.BinA184]|nr:MAG: Na(+)-translocating NADH-quinone reductase subunit C [Lentisphaerae bacterium ADurb.BinA184]
MSKAYILGFMAVLSAVFGAAVCGLHLAAKPRVEHLRQLRTQRAWVEATALAEAGGLDDAAVRRLVEEQMDTTGTLTDPETGRAVPLIKAYEDAARTRLKGYAFPFRGFGFWAPIEGILGVTPDLRRTTGLVILEQQETPGLGGRIAEPIFTQPFARGVTVAPPVRAGQPFLTIRATAPDPAHPDAARHVDAISGATQTCLAMEKLLNEALAGFHRAMAAHPAADPQAAAAHEGD